MITIKIADIPIGLVCRYEYTERFVSKYIVDEKPEFTVSATDEDIAAERVISGVTVPDYYAENVVLYRKIAEKLSEYSALVFHGAILEYEDKAYAITAHSGVGKTTHTRLWLGEFNDKAKILNGDKPILRIMDDGTIYACSTPWMGKEGYGYNAMRPLGAIAFLARGKKNVSRTTDPSSAVMRFMNQVYLSKNDALSLMRSMRVCDKILSSVPLYELECNMDPEAAYVSRDALVNGKTNG